MVNPALIAVNSRYSHSNLALLYLRRALRGRCSLIEWDINRSMRGLLEKLLETDYSHYIFSVYIWNAEYIKQIIQDLANIKPDAVICCGGPEAVYNSSDWKKLPGLNYILDGNAEDYAAALSKLLPSPGLDRTLNKSAEIVKVNPAEFSKTVFPYDTELLKELEGRLIYYEASRGCAFNCSYCLSAASRKPPEYRKKDQIIEEIKLLSEFKGTVKFVDRTFNYNKTISRLIWRMMTENPPKGCFHFEIHPALLDDEDIDLLINLPPGTARLEIGIQSTDPVVLKNIRRADSWMESEKKIKKLTADSGLHVHLDQIIGLPGDTPRKAAETMDRILSLKPEVFQPGFLKVLPGTPLKNETESYRIKASAAPPYEILNSADFSFSELQHFHRLEELISILYNSGYFRRSLNFLAEKYCGWFRLLEDILSGKGSDTPADTEIKRWEYWGERLLKTAETAPAEELQYIIDLLRLDWCPFANSQRYPQFIEYRNTQAINNMKKEVSQTVLKNFPEVTKSELKRAILFIPESHNNREKLKPQLFVRHLKKIINIPVDIEY